MNLCQMRKQGSVAIANCSSIGGLIDLLGGAIYLGIIETPMIEEMLVKEPEAMKEI